MNDLIDDGLSFVPPGRANLHGSIEGHADLSARASEDVVELVKGRLAPCFARKLPGRQHRLEQTLNLARQSTASFLGRVASASEAESVPPAGIPLLELGVDPGKGNELIEGASGAVIERSDLVAADTRRQALSCFGLRRTVRRHSLPGEFAREEHVGESPLFRAGREGLTPDPGDLVPKHCCESLGSVSGHAVNPAAFCFAASL